MAIIRDEKGVISTIETRAGIQLRQYASQLRKAGLLDAIYLARGARRAQLEAAANALIRDLRSGRINQATKDNAAQLGLRIYPNTK